MTHVTIRLDNAIRTTYLIICSQKGYFTQHYDHGQIDIDFVVSTLFKYGVKIYHVLN